MPGPRQASSCKSPFVLPDRPAIGAVRSLHLLQYSIRPRPGLACPVLTKANPGSRLWLVCPILCNAAGHRHVVAAAVAGSSDACRRHSVCLCFCLCFFYFTAASITVFFFFSAFFVLVQRYRHLRALCLVALAWHRLGTRQSPPRKGPRAASCQR